MNNTIPLRSINDKRNALKKVNSIREFLSWQKGTTFTLLDIYEQNDKRITSFEQIQVSIDSGSGEVERLQEAIKEADDMLVNLIKGIGAFGVPKLSSKVDNDRFNIHVNQHNNQNQSTSVEIKIDLIFESLRDELTGGQIKELKEILQSGEDSVTKKRKFSEKLKSFSSDVASNVLANLLTNPLIYEQLGRML